MNEEIKVSEMPEAVDLNYEDIFMIIQNKTNKKCQMNRLKDWINTDNELNFINYTVNNDYIGETGWCTCYKANHVVMFSFNFNIINSPPSGAILISGLPKCIAERFMTRLANSEAYITSHGELKAGGGVNNGWTSENICYPTSE